jgi:hypothetical protein
LITDPVLRISLQTRVLLDNGAGIPAQAPDDGRDTTWWPALRHRLRKAGIEEVRTLCG